MKELYFTPEANCDLEEIWYYIARDSVKHADKKTESIKKRLVIISQMPHCGTLVENADGNHRFFIIDQYRILYIITDIRIEILRIFHTSRHTDDLLH